MMRLSTRGLPALVLLVLSACDFAGPTAPGTHGNAAVMLELVRRAAEQGDAGAQTSLGYWYETGAYGLPRQPQEALRLYRLAAAQGNPIAEINLAVFYARGRMVAQDDKEAVRLLERAAASGDARAQRYLQAFYTAHRGGATVGDPATLAALRQAAGEEMAQGCKHGGTASLALSYVLESGEGGVAPDLDQAIRLADCALGDDPRDLAHRQMPSIEDSQARKAREKELARLAALKARRQQNGAP